MKIVIFHYFKFKLLRIYLLYKYILNNDETKIYVHFVTLGSQHITD